MHVGRAIPMYEIIITPIEVFFDTLYLWSYVEKRNLETAICRFEVQNPIIGFETIWRPFSLVPFLNKGA
ncbi:hypothetical protein DCS_06085 [Drechmeria coniospora]|uniref:Uncharacterized protein n=1 Tax=Drechmeria coniospora TaxID=98403 RepID=A0A151GAL9_DRECN|nr:hypothetical protein DCS_06085 [Drechmeria coniospora]KYK54128.1 hypothetical protein DCS_06085 [Drechmeria coniospora]